MAEPAGRMTIALQAVVERRRMQKHRSAADLNSRVRDMVQNSNAKKPRNTGGVPSWRRHCRMDDILWSSFESQAPGTPLWHRQAENCGS